MKKVLSLVALAMISTIMFAVNDGAKTNQNKKEAKSGEVIVMNKEMFINDVFDYQNSKEWKYKGDKPAIIDLYADWCGPCRMTAPINRSLKSMTGRS
jgi:thiol-disulfide isomerase/thioredoxin